jgi:hypothetical protein
LAIEICERRVQARQTAHSKSAESVAVAELFKAQYFPEIKKLNPQTIRNWLAMTPEGRALWDRR